MFEVSVLAHQYLPCVAVAREYAYKVNLTLGHYRAREVGVVGQDGGGEQQRQPGEEHEPHHDEGEDAEEAAPAGGGGDECFALRVQRQGGLRRVGHGRGEGCFVHFITMIRLDGVKVVNLSGETIGKLGIDF